MLEEMSAFFTQRVVGYDEHMLNDVEGCREGYARLARELPAGISTILDLGCGTGLELDRIFERFPDISVTGVDMTRAMLDELKRKHPDKYLTLVCGDYFKEPFGGPFDAAVSFETIHHFTRAEKTVLFKKIFEALLSGGVYVECDYIAASPEIERELMANKAALLEEAAARAGEIYHYDTPLCLDNELGALRDAGFTDARALWAEGNTYLISARKL